MSTSWLWQTPPKIICSINSSFAWELWCLRPAVILWESQCGILAASALATPCELLAPHTAVRYAFGLLLQLGAGRASVGWSQEDVACAVPDSSSGAGAQTQTPGRPERHFAVQWRRWIERDTRQTQYVWAQKAMISPIHNGIVASGEHFVLFRSGICTV